MTRRNNGISRNLLYELDRTHLLPVEPKIDIDWTWIDESNYAEVLAFRKASVAKAFKRMLEVGRKGAFAIYQGQVVAYCWVCIGKSIAPNVKVNDLAPIREDEAYIHSCYTHCDYRGNNIFPFLIYVLSDYLFEVEKVRVVFIDTYLDNISSQRGIEKVGFREKCLVERLRLFGKTIFRRFKAL